MLKRLLNGRYFYSTEVQKLLNNKYAAAEALQQFKQDMKSDYSSAMCHRKDLYQILCKNKFGGIDDSIISLIPSEKRLLFDHLFNVQLLSSINPGALESYIQPSCGSNTFYAEKMLQTAVKYLLLDENSALAASLFASSLINIGINPVDISKTNHPWALNLLKTIAHASNIESVLAGLYSQNKVLASRLASSLLVHFPSHENTKLAKYVLELKLEQNDLQRIDLQWVMFLMVYLNQADRAIQLYDQNPHLHGEQLIDPLLVAAAQQQDFELLQATFEKIDLNARSSQHHETALRAVGELGGVDLLDQIYRSAISSPKSPSLNVQHALIYCYGRLGRPDLVKKIFEQLNCPPTRLTYNVMLRALRGSMDLDYCFQLIGKMVGEEHIPLSNSELSLLLTICAEKKDVETTESIFEWARNLLVPDLASWNAYIAALRENPLKALKAYEELPLKPDLITFTTILAPFARLGDEKRVTAIVAAKKASKVKSDITWLAALLSYHALRRDISQAEKVFDKIISNGSREKIAGGYYSVMLDMYTSTKNFGKAQKLVKDMLNRKIPAGSDFFAKYIRYFVKLDQPHSLDLAYKVALELLNDANFAPSSRYIPRTVIPVLTVQPLVRELIKKGRFSQAHLLLEKVAAQSQVLSQPWKITGLRMELAKAIGKKQAVPNLWTEFLSQVESICVPIDGGRKVPQSLRHNFWREIEAQIWYLVEAKHFKQLSRLPRELERMGLALNTKNWNYLVKQLLTCGTDSELLNAYKVVENHRLAVNWYNSQKLDENIHPLLDGRTIRMLYSSMAKLVALCAKKYTQSLEETWKQMPKMFPTTLRVFHVLKKRRGI